MCSPESLCEMFPQMCLGIWHWKDPAVLKILRRINSLSPYSFTICGDLLWIFPRKTQVFQRPCRSVLLPSFFFATTVVNYNMTVVFLEWQGPWGIPKCAHRQVQQAEARASEEENETANAELQELRTLRLRSWRLGTESSPERGNRALVTVL